MSDDIARSRDEGVDPIVAEVLRLRELGREPEAAELVARHPEIAGSVEALLRDADAQQRQAARASRASIETDTDNARETQVKPLPGPGGDASDPASVPGQAKVARPEMPEPATTFAFTAPQEPIRVGHLFGRYRIEKLLGEGAMGKVYLAHDTHLDRKVALKTPKFTRDNAERLGKRFRREARSAATLHHRNICPVYDVGQIDGVDFLTMGYIEGKPLSAYVSPDKPLGQRQIALVVRKLALALQAAHDAGVIHRDLKPSNVMIDGEGEPVVMDFGLAGRVDNAGHSQLTRTGTILGTPAYMSPEQIEGAQKLIGPRSDIYALGVVMYELLAGRLPFRGSPAAVMGKVLMAKPPSLQKLREELDPQLVEICDAMMAKSPSQRMGSMKEVAERLTRWIRQSRQADQLPPAPPSPAESAPPAPVMTTGEEMAALPREGAANWKIDRLPVSEARHTQAVHPVGRLFKLRAWYASLSRQQRSVLLALSITVPILLFGATAILRSTIDNDKATGDVARADQPVSGTASGERENSDDAASRDSLGTGNNASSPRNVAMRYGPWTTLFAGNGTDAWESLGVFRAVGNELIANRQGVARTRRSFADFELEFEWKLADGGNSGVYYRAEPRIETAVLFPRGSAEFALDSTPGRPNELASGALWNVLPVSRQTVIDSSRYHSARIVCAGTRVEHWINGVQVLAYDTASSAFASALATCQNRQYRETGPRSSGPIYLQANVNEVRFRNLRIRDILPSGSAPGQTASNRQDGPTGQRFVNSVGMAMTLIPAGTFTMGSPPTEIYRTIADEHRHQITITQPFYMQTTEVTHRQWRDVMGTEPWKGQSRVVVGDDVAANYITWEEADAFCKELSRREGRTYLLPTEAQREYACRAGTSTAYYFGNDPQQLNENAWWGGPWDSSGNTSVEKYPHRVGLKKPNGFGLYDMIGNVDEWCRDYYDADYYQRSPPSDPTGPSTGTLRVSRGGGWLNGAGELRSANRHGTSPLHRGPNYGFRVVTPADHDESSDGWISLTDSSLVPWRLVQAKNEGWKPLHALWKSENDILRATRGGQHWIETIQKFKDFEFRCDYRMPNPAQVGANGSGVVVRADGRNRDGFDPKGIEIDLRTSFDEATSVGTGCFIAYESAIQNHRGIVTGLSTQGRLGWLRRPRLIGNEWNELEIRCAGGNMEVRINGDLVNRGWNLSDREGSICLRSQNTVVEFRNVRVKRLAGADL